MFKTILIFPILLFSLNAFAVDIYGYSNKVSYSVACPTDEQNKVIETWAENMREKDESVLRSPTEDNSDYTVFKTQNAGLMPSRLMVPKDCVIATY